MKLNQGNIVWLIVGVLLGVAGGVGSMALSNRVRPAPIVIEPPAPTATPEPTPTPGPITVFVNGAVANPGVYTLAPESRVEQAIEVAGGFTSAANTAVVNLAQPLADGVQVYIPSQEEVSGAPPAGVNQTNTVLISASSSGESGGLININTASLDELDSLPGIGPSTAQKIIDYRENNGPFATIEDIMNVAGIGESKFNQIKDLITVGTP